MFAPRCLVALLLSFACGACGAAPVAPAPVDEGLVQPRPLEDDTTEVVFLGAIGTAHLTSAYDTARLEDAIVRFAPDIILVEITPLEFDRAIREMTASADTEGMTGAWASQPELYRAIVPLAADRGYELVPVSGWTPEARADREAYFEANEQGPRIREYQFASAIFHAGLLQNGHGHVAWLHSDDFLEVTTERSRWLSYGAEGAMGHGGELRVHAAHAALIADAIRAHPGARVAVVFDVESRWYLEPAIDALDGVRRIDALDVLAP